MAPQSDQPWPWFWLRNVGLFLPLFAGLALLGGAPRRLRRLTTPLWLWFIVPNLIAFHPSEWNNTKYFVFWQIAGCLLIASWLSRAFSAAMARRPSRPAIRGADRGRGVLLVDDLGRRAGHGAGDAALDRDPVGRARRRGRRHRGYARTPTPTTSWCTGRQHISSGRAQRPPCGQRIHRLDVRPRPARLGDPVDRHGDDPEWRTRGARDASTDTASTTSSWDRSSGRSSVVPTTTGWRTAHWSSSRVTTASIG